MSRQTNGQLNFFQVLDEAKQEPLPLFTEGDLIHVYTRAQAIEDGLLVDVSPLAREAGFVWPVAITAALHQKIEDIPASQSHQDYGGRLWDVLWMASLRVKYFKRENATEGEIYYKLIMHHIKPDRNGHNRLRTYITLKIVMGAEGPNGEPCLTIMLPGEDK